MKSLLLGVLLFAAIPTLASQDKFKCVGTEPFWNAQVGSDSIVLAAPGQSGQKLVITQRSFPIGVPPQFGQVIKAKGGEVDAVFTIRADAKCTDGMSDAEYSHEAWFLKGDDLVVGCCNRTK